jgi:CBS-domain-containing membrane protein
MTLMNIAHQRLLNQQIAVQTLPKPDDVVRWLGAVQAQDYAAAKWAVAQRTKGITDSAVNQAFNKGEIFAHM